MPRLLEVFQMATRRCRGFGPGKSGMPKYDHVSRRVVNLQGQRSPETHTGSDQAVPPKSETPQTPEMPKETGFKYEGPEPTQYGDWAHKGRVTDF